MASWGWPQLARALLLKGILDPGDAQRAVQAGVAGMLAAIVGLAAGVPGRSARRRRGECSAGMPVGARGLAATRSLRTVTR